MRKYFFLLIFLFNTFFVVCQQDRLIKSFEDSLKKIETISYSATLLRKKFGSEEFNERYFDVYAKRNSSNKGYNFDWEIVEYKEGAEQRYLFVGEDFLYINKKHKVIGYRHNVKHLLIGDYFEAMRWHTLFDEVLYNFDTLYKDRKIEILSESENEKFRQIKIELNEAEDRYLFLNSINLFPEKVRNVVREKKLDLIQITETNLSNIKFNAVFSDTVLSPQYYLKQDYKLTHSGNEVEEEDTKPIQKFTTDQIDFLFQTTLVSSTGDSISLDKIEADLLLIDFWFMSCVPCLKSIPHLQELSDKYKSKGFKVVGINCHDIANKESVVKKLKKKGISYSNFFADKSILKQLDINAFPTFIIVDKNQKVIYTEGGIGKNFESIIEEKLKE